MELPMLQIVADIKVSIGSKQPIDAALIVLKLTDYRATPQEIISIKSASKFFANFEPKKIFLIITHCDLMKIEEEQVLGKLESFKKWAKVDIPRQNAILFDNTPESL